MENHFLQYTILILWSVCMWFWGRFWHQDPVKQYPMFVCFIAVPKWLMWLCGNPRLDGRLELAGIVFQMMMLLSVLSILMFLIFSVEFKLRAYIIFSIYGLAIGFAAMIRVAVYLWHKLIR